MYSFQNMIDCLKIPLTDILTATNNFADENIIKREGFGNEYKGRLVLSSSSGELIDIVTRRLMNVRYLQGTKEFHTELMMLSSLKHQNLVTIVGFCEEKDEKIIINKLEAKGSLDQYLSDPVTLTWTQRLHICLGIARALSYIHYDEGRGFSVIHRTIKSSNILLDDKWEPKLSGFELSTMQPAFRRHCLILDAPCGTPGYVDPAYQTSSSVSHKSDVYSFGVVLFEVLSGRLTYSLDNKYAHGMVFLDTLAKSSYENGTLHDMIHPVLRNQINPQALKIYAEAAYCCLKDQRAQRPHIDRVIVALEQALQLQFAFENSLVSQERSVALSLTNHWKEKDLEHLKIEFDAIKLATENFADKYHIGSGGYGVVYKAELEHFDYTAIKGNKESEPPRRCSTVAIKKIFDREDRQGEQGFIVEIDTLSSCMHPNVVSLLGFCHDPPHMILIYEHVSNGSLDDYLGREGKMTNFTWVQRIKICIDIARGLGYIHATLDNKQKIIHRDIKSANILLGEKWEAKIADFGLSKLHPLNHTQSTLNTNHVVGTRVYWDPEYERTGNLKKESDVYSFGVVLFEIVTGRLAYDPVYTKENEKGLAPIVRQNFQKGTIREMIDPNLKEESTFTLSDKGLDQDSLNTVLTIGHRCLSEKQVGRPTMKVVIEELEKALLFQETQKDNLLISFEDIRLATQNFTNQIGSGGFGQVYSGEILLDNGPTPIAVKRYDQTSGQGYQEFVTELQILLEYKHENIIGLLGYCNENNEKIIVYEYASKGSLDKHLNDANLTWMKRLKIGIDAAVGLDFLHGGDLPVVHRDIKASNILLNDDWKSKITDFGLSMIAALNNENDFVFENACGTPGYIDPQFAKEGILTKKSDIYSFGVVLFEMLCGRTAFPIKGKSGDLGELVIRHYEEGKIYELVFEGIKDQIAPNSLIAFLEIAYECLHDKREMRPTASKVALQLKKALKFQEDIEIWAAKLPTDYKEIIKMSKNAEMLYNSNVSNKDLYDMLSKGILLQNGKVCLSIGNNGERNEMVSATMFSYENNILHNKRISIPNSRFQRVVKIMDISNLKIQIKIITQFLSPNVMYGVHLVFKFCDPRKISTKLMYVNLKFHIGDDTLNAYFAKQEEDDEWMSIELVRLTTQDPMSNIKFSAQLESLSRYYCGNAAIYVEGIHFRAISDHTTLKLSSLGKVNRKKCHMLPAKMVLHKSNPNVKCFKWNYRVEPESRFVVVGELLSHQVFRIKCKIKAQKLSRDTNYACYLLFKLTEQCHGLECPVKVQDMLLRKNKELKYIFFRNPRYAFQHGTGRVSKRREDGLMEVIVWELNSGNMKLNDDHLIPMNLKLRCYEGNMFGLIVYGIEFRPV